MHVIEYYALVPVDSAGQALESYELLRDPLPDVAYHSRMNLDPVSTPTLRDMRLR